jgi:hypothetical protein
MCSQLCRQQRSGKRDHIEALEAALRFLLDRLDELDFSDADVANDFNGHVTPAISRARAALACREMKVKKF